MDPYRWRVVLPLLFAVATLMSSVHGRADTFPTRPVHVILGFAPGSAPDVVSRIAADGMAAELGQPVLIENRPGAAGIIATDAVVRAPADGYTLLVSGCSADGIVYAYVMAGRQPFDPLKDFTPVGQVMRDYWLVAVPDALHVDSIDQLVAMGKKSPEPLTFPSTGVGSSQHLQSERFAVRVGIRATHVPYKDSPVSDLLTGRLSFVVNSAAAIAPLVNSGKLKGLAVLSPQRVQSLPNVPSAAEAGIPDLLYTAGVCLYAPANTPRDIVTRLNSALNKAEGTQELARRFFELGVEPVQRTPEETAQFIRELMDLVDHLRVAVFGKAR